MLDRAIAEHTIERDRGGRRIDAVADLLIAFYRSAPPADLSPRAYVERFASEQAKNEAVLRDPRFGLDRARVDYALDRVRRGLEEDAAMLRKRVEQGHIVEGHGDLRPEHICLSDPPVIIDCLEFSRDFRLVDPFDELSFLTLECERLGAGWVGNHLIERCADGLGDAPRRACSNSTGCTGPACGPASPLPTCSIQNRASHRNGCRSPTVIWNSPRPGRSHRPFEQFRDQAAAMAAADGFGEERRGGDDADAGIEHAGRKAKRRYGIRHEGHGEVRLADHLARIADKEAVGGEGKHLCRSVLAGSLRRSGKRSAGADEIVDEENGRPFDLSHQEPPLTTPALRRFSRKALPTGLPRLASSVSRKSCARFTPPGSGEATTTGLSPIRARASLANSLRGSRWMVSQRKAF